MQSAITASLPALLADRAREQPDALAYKFIDYDVDPAGSSRVLRWSQVHTRSLVVATELASCGSPGDRVAICAPQGLEYIVAFLGAVRAGFIAVPLPVPHPGADDRVSAALEDSAPVAILTTSDAVSQVETCARGLSGFPAVIEIDALDLYTPPDNRIDTPQTETALLQYTSGSTRAPRGVVVTHRNIFANFEQALADHFEDDGGVTPPDLTLVSWLPFFHDMGLQLGITAPVLIGRPAVLKSPVAFLQKPARWIRLLATTSQAFSAGPNFAFELVVRRTSDDDMAGLDLGDVSSITTGGERVHAKTIHRFTERFPRFNLPDKALRPSYGLAEAMVYVTSSAGRVPRAVRFDYEKLSAGYAKPCAHGQAGSDLVSHGPPRACTVRIVDPETRTQNPAGKVGEIWVHGDNVAAGYWRNPQLPEQTFGGQLADASPGTPKGPWLRTGDLGVISDGELFIVGRIKDLLIVDGRNHYPDDIESTIQEITGGRAAAVATWNGRGEELVAIAEVKQRGSSEGESLERVLAVKRRIISAVSTSHGLRLTDLVVVAPGSIPITTSGKVRCSACAEQYQQNGFDRLDTSA